MRSLLHVLVEGKELQLSLNERDSKLVYEGEVVFLSMIVCNRGIDIAVKIRKTIYEIPHFIIIGMEDMRTISMNIDSLNALRVTITGYMVPSIDNKAFLSCIGHQSCKGGTIEACANYKKIVHVLLSAVLTVY